MKLWIDAQLSPAIAAWINRTFDDIEAEPVRTIGKRLVATSFDPAPPYNRQSGNALTKQFRCMDTVNPLN